MANQFSAKILFYPVAWRAYDSKSKTASLVVDNGGENVTWSVRGRGFKVEGTSKSPSSARAACRRAIARYMREKTS